MDEATKPTEAATKPPDEVTEPTVEATKPPEEVTEPTVEATKPPEEVTKPAAETKPTEEAPKPPSLLTRILARLKKLFDPTPPLHTLHATRTLPYAPLPIYNLLTDIPSYPTWAPYVVRARTKTLSPRPDTTHSRHWPAVVTIEVQFGSFAHETFDGNIICEPPSEENPEGVVETYGGAAVPRLKPKHYDEYVVPEGGAVSAADSPLRGVRAVFRVKELEGSGGSRVSLVVEYAFKTQTFEMTGNSMARKVTNMVVDAFEARCKQVLGKK